MVNQNVQEALKKFQYNKNKNMRKPRNKWNHRALNKC
jgi:hypothetical protein